MAGLVSIKFWNADFRMPFEYHWDSVHTLGQVKGVIENGSFLGNPSLGAPLGQQFQDFYQGDLLGYLILYPFSVFSDDPALVVNLAWLAGFPLVAATAWWAFHSLGLSRPMALTGAVLFALLPYHFWRGESHLSLSVYFAVPLAAWLVIQVLQGKMVISRTMDRRRALGVALICLVIGFSGGYYSVLSLALLAGASAVVLLQPGRRRAALGGLAAGGLIALALIVSYSPTLIYESANGKNTAVAERTLNENEKFALSFSQLVLPATNHRLDFFAELKDDYLDQTIVPSEDAQALGVAGTIGLIWLILVALASVIARLERVREIERQASVAALIAFLVATIGGVSAIFALTVTPQIRAWNRMSVFIGFFALLGFVALLSRVDRRVCLRKHGGALSVVIIAFVIGFAAWDQSPARWTNQLDVDEIKVKYERDDRYLNQVEQRFPEGSMIFQIPYAPYPEGFPTPGTMDDYDHLKAYIHSDGLRWSYGAMRGRSADIAACIKGLPLERLVPVVSSWGFSGLWIDLLGYAPERRRSVLAAARRATGVKPLLRDDSRIAVFGLEKARTTPPAGVSALPALPLDGAAQSDCAVSGVDTGQAGARNGAWPLP